MPGRTPAAGFPDELKQQFWFNSRWLELTREELDSVTPGRFRPPASMDTPLRMHLVDEGDGEPVVCVHGNPTWSFYWRRLIKELSGDYRVIVPDHIGMGWSDKPGRFPYRLANHIHNLERVVDQLGLRDITLVVHDWGGPIGLGYAARHPSNVARLVITNTAAFDVGRAPWRLRLARVPVLGALLVRGFNLFVRSALTQATNKPERLHGDAGRGLVWPYDSWANRVAIHRFVQDIPLSPRDPSWPVLKEIEAGLPALKDKPVMLAWGMTDWVFTPAMLERFEQAFPDAEVLREPEAGHYLMEDAWETVCPAIRQFIEHGDDPLASGGTA